MSKIRKIILSTCALAIATLGVTTNAHADANFNACVQSIDWSNYTRIGDLDQVIRVNSDDFFFADHVGDTGYFCLSRNQLIGDAESACSSYGAQLAQLTFGKPYEYVLNQYTGQLGGNVPLHIVCNK
jgi:hypothetical protein